MTTRHCTATRLMAMLRRLKIDIRQNFDLNMPLVAQAARQCEKCPRTDACDEWFSHGAEGDGYRSFCPNLERLEYLPHGRVVDYRG